jgi:hypothetical protein
LWVSVALPVSAAQQSVASNVGQPKSSKSPQTSRTRDGGRYTTTGIRQKLMTVARQWDF